MGFFRGEKYIKDGYIPFVTKSLFESDKSRYGLEYAIKQRDARAAEYEREHPGKGSAPAKVEGWSWEANGSDVEGGPGTLS